MADFQDKNIEMNVSSEGKICANGDVGSNECKLTCALKKSNDECTLNGINGIECNSDQTDTTASQPSGENVKLNGNAEANVIPINNDAATVSSSGKVTSSDESNVPENNEEIETKSSTVEEETIKDKVKESCTETNETIVESDKQTESAETIAESDKQTESVKTVVESEKKTEPVETVVESEKQTESIADPATDISENPVEITESADVKNIESSIVDEKCNVDYVEVIKAQHDTDSKSNDSIINAKTSSADEKEKTSEVVTTNDEKIEPKKPPSVEDDEVCTIVPKTTDEFAKQPESDDPASVKDDEICAIVSKTTDEFTKPSEPVDNTIEGYDKTTEVTESSDTKMEISSVVDNKNNDNDEETSNVQKVENCEKDHFTAETKPAVVNEESVPSSENFKTSEETLPDEVEKMEVDEVDNAPNGSESISNTPDEKNIALSNDCRVVLVKVNESPNEKGDLDSEKRSQIYTESSKGIKRKHSSENEASEDDTSKKSDTDKKTEDITSPVQKNKKQKLEVNDKEKPEEKVSQQESPSSARKSKRLSDKSKETKTEGESTRKSGRSVVKKELASPESEKSPSKKSRQSTPNSTPRKSITPSPRSKSKNELDSTSASENDKTPQKRVSSRSKRSLNLDSDEETSPSNAAKRQQRKVKSASKAKTAQSSDEDHVSEEEGVSHSAKKSRSSKSKGASKGIKNSAAKSPAGSGFDSDDDSAVRTTIKKSRRSVNSKEATNKLDKMKRLLIVANLKVSNYTRFFKDCHTDKEKIDFIVNYLREKGLKGEPTIQNCQKLGKKIARDKELASLDKNNIIDSSPSTSGTRVTRSRRSTSRRS